MRFETAWGSLKARGLFALVVAPLLMAGPVREDPRDRLVVHEWGTFTSVVGEDGLPVEWRPLGGPRDLPRFVHASGHASGDRCPRRAFVGKPDLRAIVRMETPVLYFYSDRDITASVNVGFPDGTITEWYPRARSSGSRIAWDAVEVRPGEAIDPPLEGEPSHYYAARETDAAPLRVSGAEGPEHEKFLFYRGVGTLQPSLWIMLRGGQLKIRNVGAVRVPQVVLFENRGGRVGYAVHDLVSRQSAIERPALDGSVDALCDDLRAMLVQQGLYAREAEAMVATWRDSWFEEGLRAFYVLPRPVTDAVLPITLSPRPTELVRVLVARTEILTPEMERDFERQVETLADAPEGFRAAAAALLETRGRFAEPILRRIAARTRNAETKARIAELIAATDVRALPEG